MSGRFNRALMEIASQIGTAQSGEHVRFSGVDENGVVVIRKQEAKYHVTNRNNYFDGELSADAFRFALTMMAASNLSVLAYENKGVAVFEQLSEEAGTLYHKVRDIAYATLPKDEAAAMTAYLD